MEQPVSSSHFFLLKQKFKRLQVARSRRQGLRALHALAAVRPSSNL
jgi:hypothetical protein